MKVKKVQELPNPQKNQSSLTLQNAGWECCKPRVLTFEEFMTIPGCTTGTHTTVETAPAPAPIPKSESKLDALTSSLEAALRPAVPRTPSAIAQAAASAPTPPPELESDDPSLSIPKGAECRRKGCTEKYDPVKGREGEKCVHHPGLPVFHEGSKGWSCCKRRVLEFDEFMKIEGCTTKDRHVYIGKPKKDNEEEKLESVR
jgi:hypothetical protein